MVSENLTFKNQLVSAVEKYPSLCIKKDTNGHEYLHGTLDIFNDENLIAGSFMVEIHGTEKISLPISCTI
ncbi:MAG: hypothetical protein IPK08_14245 [Bacteroidetes bacterium]|nr:hypothetical protein [Bacteroidota bacterium]